MVLMYSLIPSYTDVDVEVAVADVDAVDGLAEVDVGYAVIANVVVLLETELSIGQNLLDELGGGLDVSSTLKKLERLVGLDSLVVNVLRVCLNAGRLSQIRLQPHDRARLRTDGRMGVGQDRGAHKAENYRRLHLARDDARNRKREGEGMVERVRSGIALYVRMPMRSSLYEIFRRRRPMT